MKVRWGIGVGVLLLWLILYVAVSGGLLKTVEERGTDLLWRLAATTEPERRVIVVDIDDRSLAEHGPWPWAPAVMGELVRKLDAQRVSAKLFDIVFPQERGGSTEFSRALAQSDPPPGQDAPQSGQHQAISRISPAWLSQVFALRGETTLRLGVPTGHISDIGCHPAGAEATGVIANAYGLHHRAGHITPALDADGAVRRVPALVCYEGRTYPALSLAALTRGGADGNAEENLRLRVGAVLTEPHWVLETPALPGYQIGLDGAGQIRVPFRQSRQSFLSVSAADVMAGRVPTGLLDGAWVIIGASAFGLSDVIPTALGSAVSGAEIHAQLLTAMLDDQIPFTPRGAGWVQGGYVLLGVGLLLLIVIGSPLTVGRRVVLQPLVAMVLAAGAYGLHASLLVWGGWYLGWVAPAVALLTMGVAMGVAEHALSQETRVRLFQNLSSYISPPVAQRVALAVPTDQIEAHRAQVTVLVADVNNFSAYCEARSPEDAARVLHRFYSTASDIMLRHGGVVQEMVGDRLLAVFNGVTPCPEHAMQAINSAGQIWLHCGEELPNTLAQGLEPMSVSIGIETGTVLQGSFGAAQRRVHTVLGQTVTVALRLCAMTNDLAYPILVGEGAAQQVLPRIDQPQSMLKPLGSFLLPGLSQGTKVYTPKHAMQINVATDLANLEYLRQKSFST